MGILSLGKWVGGVAMVAGLFLMSSADVAAQKYTTGGTGSEPVSAPAPPKKGNDNAAKPTTTTTKKTEKAEGGGNLELIGMLGGQSVYNMYLVIGAITDNYVSGNYEAGTASELLDVQISFATNIPEKLRALRDGGDLTEGDKEVLTDMIDIYAGLKKQAQHGKAYIDGDEGASSKFETQRKSNWSKITALLGIE